MPKVADAIAADLSAIQPAHAAYFKANAAAFTASLSGLEHGDRQLQGGTTRASPSPSTEPVADYLLHRARRRQPDAVDVPGRHHERHRPLAAGRGRAAGPVHRAQGQGVPLQPAGHGRADRVVHQLAQQNHIPVVGVYETMPAPGYDYQTWMLTEVQDLRKAVADKVSTEHL